MVGSLAVLVAFGCSSLPGRGSSESVPDERGIAIFTRFDEIAQVKISPDGGLLAVRSRSGRQGSLAFMRSDTLEVVSGFRFEGTQTIYRFEWAANDRVVIELAEEYGPLDEAPFRTGEI